MSSKILQINAQDINASIRNVFVTENAKVRWKLCEMKEVYVTAHVKKKKKKNPN